MPGIGDLASGLSTLIGGTGASGPRSAVRNSAQGAMQAYVNSTGLQLDWNRLFDPAFTALGNNNLRDMLLGTEAGTRTVSGTYLGRPYTREQSVDASPGLLELIRATSGQLQDTSNQNLSAARRQQLADYAELLPGFRAAYDASTPELAGLRDRLSRAATDNLDLGARMSPELERSIRNAGMGSSGARGWGYNPGDLARIFSETSATGEALRSNRVNQAGGLYSLLASATPDFSRLITGTGDNSTPTAANMLLATQPLGYTREFDPLNPTAAGLSAMGQQSLQAGRAAESAAWGQTVNGLMSLASSFAGGMGGGI